ncbi:hypothetical protein RHMOL_Rhmol04G0063100 [Rhododendron molle]|uniref:Uncharacterized protein n=1 Tax=Rhododendron molle TaxID=49168 RepID=A0ACC0NYS6_RHOML|nr:hypothetical protein RHMOL_Rhmol04G0063100 [Rhododendron molle]
MLLLSHFSQDLLTRHKSTVADFLLRNYQWFFREYNSRLLESPNYITRRHAVKVNFCRYRFFTFRTFFILLFLLSYVSLLLLLRS